MLRLKIFLVFTDIQQNGLQLMSAVMLRNSFCACASCASPLTSESELAGYHHDMNYRSVTAFGKAMPVADEAEKEQALGAFVDHIIPGRNAQVSFVHYSCCHIATSALHITSLWIWQACFRSARSPFKITLALIEAPQHCSTFACGCGKHAFHQQSQMRISGQIK